MANPQPRLNAPKAEWFSRCGLPDTAPISVNDYARRLCRYIADPSTVRVRTLEQYGKAPPLEKIRTWRADWLAERDWCRGERDPQESAAEADRVHEFCAAIAARIAAGDMDVATPANDEAAEEVGDVDDGLPAPAVPPMAYTDVLAQCARQIGVSVEDMLSRSRKARIVRARQFAATVLRSRGNSYPCVGRYLSGRDHSTIMHAVDTFFHVGMRDPMYVEAWGKVAPCAAKFARSRAELDMVMVARP
ncbi:helix-turn-helix domain-containing protein [Novosphingobium sp. ST904]|uniref:helix-turn-helix domain-containing protein n=1 Tax=Novosphingobium sp. ST904 TaxID=1684385 RepID=UPI0009EB6F6A|nr:helix-turn-helix domain-containing protein [Novosphingobium sp. ST904]TCM30047.1 chromosomal replication initiator protein [Novosphingobium sp. ST904]